MKKKKAVAIEDVILNYSRMIKGADLREAHLRRELADAHEEIFNLREMLNEKKTKKDN